jgi:hypothetical protein
MCALNAFLDVATVLMMARPWRWKQWKRTEVLVQQQNADQHPPRDDTNTERGRVSVWKLIFFDDAWIAEIELRYEASLLARVVRFLM